MKKHIILAMVLVLMFSSYAIAASDDNTTAGPGSALVLTGLTIGVSNGVFAHYTDDGTAANVQWWAIATAHQGGTSIYGSAQNNSGTFSIDVGTNTITAPLIAGGTTYVLPTQAQAASDEYWTSSAWDR